MRPTPWLLAEPYRQPRHLHRIYGETRPGDNFGWFIIPAPVTGVQLRVLVGDGDGWDHVSVSTTNRCPNWPEMAFIKAMFFRDDETVMQLHVPVTDHINYAPYCLHLWRPHHVEIPRPPSYMVGPQPERTP